MPRNPDEHGVPCAAQSVSAPVHLPLTQNVANKKPRGGEARGAKAIAGENYFFAKISFAHCALWLEAELRWMTWLLTALSSAEL